MSRRKIFTDEYHYESKDETIITYTPPPPPPPKPITTTTTTVETTYYRSITPPPPPPPPKPVTTTTTTTTVTTTYKPDNNNNNSSTYVSSITPRISRIGTTRLYRSPSVRTIRVHSTPRVTFVPPPPPPAIPCYCNTGNVIDIKIEKENTCPTMKSYDYKYDYSYKESFESKKTRSKSMTRLNDDSYELEKIELKRKPSIKNIPVVCENSGKHEKRVHFCDNEFICDDSSVSFSNRLHFVKMIFILLLS